MTIEEAKTEIMQIYGSLSEEKKQALDVLMAQADGEYISRTELLKAIDTWDKFGVDDTNSLFRLDNLSLPHYVPYIHYDDVVNCIKGMPSVAIPNKVGYWIIPKDIMWENPKCSECGFESADHDNYCPHCGCPMEIER